MAWPKGKPRPEGAGRKAGTPNKRTDLFAVCAAKGISVFEEMLTIALTTTDPDKRFGMLKEIAPYLYAKKKEVLKLEDHSPEELIETAEKLIDGSKDSA